MLARVLCLLVGHRTSVTYTATEGLVQCQRCGKSVDRWPVLRPEDRHRDEARRAAFWARVDEPKIQLVRRSR